MAQDQPTRREVLKGAVYVTPAILTLVAVPAFASSGSGRDKHEYEHKDLDHGVGHPSASVGSKSPEAAENKTCEDFAVSLSGQSGRRADRSQKTCEDFDVSLSGQSGRRADRSQHKHEYEHEQKQKH